MLQEELCKVQLPSVHSELCVQLLRLTFRVRLSLVYYVISFEPNPMNTALIVDCKCS